MINPWQQGRGYRDAVRYIAGRPEVDRNRIALWGDSYSAMEVLVVGAMIEGLAAIVAQIPACGISRPEVPFYSDDFSTLRKLFEGADLTEFENDETGYIPVVSADQMGTPSLLTPIQAFRWFIDFGGRFGTGWQNRANRIIPQTSVPFSPFVSAAHLRAPLLFLTGREDEMVHCNPDVQNAVFNLLPGPKQHVQIDGGHFGLLYPGSPAFRHSVDVQCRFLRETLQAG